jgi:hypothetical protein
MNSISIQRVSLSSIDIMDEFRAALVVSGWTARMIVTGTTVSVESNAPMDVLNAVRHLVAKSYAS